jgi:hypothetical protein
MAPPPLRTLLVTLSGVAQRVMPRFLGTAPDTVDLTVIAAAADDHAGATVRAQEQPSRCRLALGRGAQNRWTNATIAGILTLHACPARCGARRRVQTAKFRSTPRLPFNQGKLLSGYTSLRQPDITRYRSDEPDRFADSHSRGTPPAPDLRGFRPPPTQRSGRSHPSAREQVVDPGKEESQRR